MNTFIHIKQRKKTNKRHATSSIKAKQSQHVYSPVLDMRQKMTTVSHQPSTTFSLPLLTRRMTRVKA